MSGFPAKVLFALDRWVKSNKEKIKENFYKTEKGLLEVVKEEVNVKIGKSLLNSVLEENNIELPKPMLGRQSVLKTDIDNNTARIQLLEERVKVLEDLLSSS